MNEIKAILTKRIIDHLRIKENQSDILDNIIISIYEDEMKSLSKNIIESLYDLMQKGIVVENKRNDDTIFYKLINFTEN
jgi:hypothetical protein